MTDQFNEECAVFGVFGSQEAHLLTALGLHALQHRGQEATGMVSFDGSSFKHHRGTGHVGENFSAGSRTLNDLSGHVAIGHNRYSTTGLSEQRNIQPFLTEMAFGSFGIDSMVRQAAARTEGARVQGTPSLMVNGKYRIDTRQAGSQANMLKIAAFLADKELARLERAANAAD